MQLWISPWLSPLCPAILPEASHHSGAAAIGAELRKLNANSTKCMELGWTCIPIAVETFGHWGREAQSVLSRLASHLSISLSQPRAAVVADIYRRLNIILVRESEPANLIPEKEYDKFTEQSAMTGNEYLDEEQRESVHMKYLPNLKRRIKDDAENEQEAVAYADKKIENARAEVAVAESKVAVAESEVAVAESKVAVAESKVAKAMKKLAKAEQEVSAAAYDEDAKKSAVLHRDLAVTSVHNANTILKNASESLAIALQCLKIATAAEHVNVMHPPAGPSSNGLRPEVEACVISACTYTDEYEQGNRAVKGSECNPNLESGSSNCSNQQSPCPGRVLGCTDVPPIDSWAPAGTVWLRLLLTQTKWIGPMEQDLKRL
eukprot:Em0012g949a